MSKIKSLLVAQPAPVIVEKSPFYELIQKYGLAIDYIPFVRVEGVNAKEFRGQRVGILDHTAIIFTNRLTIDHFFRICEESRVVVPETMKYLCSTESVALYLQKYIIYRKRKISFADGSFTGLMELILKHRDERFLLTLAEPYKPELAVSIEKLRLNCDRAILARTVNADLSGVDMSAYQMVVMYSPSEVKSFAQQFPTMKGVVGGGAEGTGVGTGEVTDGVVAGEGTCDGGLLIATFGDGTTRKAIEKGLKVSSMAPTPEAPSMARALDIFISDVNAGRAVASVAVEEDLSAKQAEAFVKIHLARELRRVKKAKKPVVAGVATAAAGSASSVAKGSDSGTAAKK